MIRSLLLEELTKTYGEPIHSHSQKWWTVYAGTRCAVRLCLYPRTASRPDVAHLLVFHAATAEGKSVTELCPSTLQETAEALQQVKQILDCQASG